MKKPTVIFLCTGNSARSQMAEGLLRAMVGEQYEVFSAGTEPRGLILPEVEQVMEEIGVDISSQRSKSATEFFGKVIFDHVITVCSDAEKNCPAVFLNMGKHEHWPFDDPAKFGDETKPESTRRVRDQIKQRLHLWLEEQNITTKEFTK